MANAFAEGETIMSDPADAGQGQAPLTPPAGAGTDLSKITSGLADIQRDKARADEGVYSGVARQLGQDAYTAHQAFNAEAATSHDIPSWNEEQERQKFSTNPIQAFGSMGSVFALVASAFTHRPMINALQGSAAAMNAIREGDDKEYDRAFTAYKTNVDLALKRHDMMHQEYQDASELMKTDMVAGEAALKLAAAKYNDKQMLFLTENGMNDEINKLVKGRADAMAGVAKANEEITTSTLRQQTFDSMKKDIEKAGIPKDDPRYAVLMAEAGRRAFAGKDTPIDDQMWQWEMQHAQDHDGKGPTSEERQEFYNHFRLAQMRGSGNVTPNQRLELDAEAEVKQAIADGKLDAKDAKAVNDYRAAVLNRLKAESSPMTPNKRADTESHIAMYDNSIKTIDKTLEKLDKYALSAGAAGKATRLGERLSNVAGGSETDRVQMMRDIEYLQVTGPRLLLDQATGRPLSAEAGKISDIIAGLNMGDTVANTRRALEEVRSLYAKMQADAQARLGPATPAAAEQAPAPSGRSKAAPWASDPVVGPRSDIAGNQQVAANDAPPNSTIDALRKLRETVGAKSSDDLTNKVDEILKKIDEALKLAPNVG